MSGCKKVGATGFCMGGALSLAAAALLPEEISAAAPFYGIPRSDLCDVGKIKAPVQAHFGSKDTLEGFSSPKDAKALAEKFDAAGVSYELHMYDTGHAFTNPTNPNYTKEICDLALGRMVDFMKKHLQWTWIANKLWFCGCFCDIVLKSTDLLELWHILL